MNEDSECIVELKRCLTKMIYMYSKHYNNGAYACVYAVLLGKYDSSREHSDSKFLISKISLYDKDFNFYRCLYDEGKSTYNNYPLWVSLRACFPNQYIPCANMTLQIRDI